LHSGGFKKKIGPMPVFLFFNTNNSYLANFINNIVMFS
jgi:hypothetical protein